MIKEMLNKCLQGKTLSVDEAESLMTQIMEGNVTSSQIASLLSILRFRGETVDEMVGFAKAMRANMISIDYGEEVIDTCGTGGDGISTFNISTTTAILLSSLGVKVAKHGNRAVSSKSGSADVLEKLGIDFQTTPETAQAAMKETGMSFLFAPLYHSAMKHVAVPRKEIGFRTIFNLLGPLCNPANARRQLIGVYDTNFAEQMAETLKTLGSDHTLFVTGRDGLDECSITTETDVVELKNGEIKRWVLHPHDVGLEVGDLDELKVNSIQESAELIRSVLKGTANLSAINIVVLNTGAALYIAGKAATIAEGVKVAREAIESGRAYQQFTFLQEKRNKRYA